MKRIIKVIVAIVLSFVAVVLIDRHVHVSKYGEYEERTYIHVNPTLLTRAPKGTWMNLEEFDMDIFIVSLVVDDYNPLFKTWKNEYECSAVWQYKGNYGEPYTFQIIESNTIFEANMVNMHETTSSKVIDNVIVNYHIPSMAENDKNFVLELKTEEKIVKLSFLYDHLEQFYPILEMLWNEIQ